MKRHQSGVVSSDSDENAKMRFMQFASILLNLGGKVIVVPRFRDFCDAFNFSIRVGESGGALVPPEREVSIGEFFIFSGRRKG